MPALAGLAISAYGAYSGAKNAKKANEQAAQAAQKSQVDIKALDAQTREIARRNAIESQALEMELNPENAALRSGATRSLAEQTNPNQYDALINDKLNLAGGSQYGATRVGDAGSGLLTDAIARARSNLSLGGKLDQDTVNATMRAGLSRAGSVSGGNNLGLGRDISARDLGLRSMDVANQRLGQASALGAQELGMNQGNQANERANNAFGLDVFNSNRGGLLAALQQQSVNRGMDFSRALQAAQLGHSIAQPVVGLDPGAVADLTVGNSNAGAAASANQANVSGQQSKNYFNLAGNVLGGVAGMISSGNPFTKPSVATPPYVAKPPATAAPVFNYGGSMIPGR